MKNTAIEPLQFTTMKDLATKAAANAKPHQIPSPVEEQEVVYTYIHPSAKPTKGEVIALREALQRTLGITSLYGGRRLCGKLLQIRPENWLHWETDISLPRPASWELANAKIRHLIRVCSDPSNPPDGDPLYERYKEDIEIARTTKPKMRYVSRYRKVVVE
jgi:hypothetical protein